MKILILGNEKGMFSNLDIWLKEAGHECSHWDKFYPKGNENDCMPCPMGDPDIILCVARFVTYEDCEKMGIANKPKRVYYNLGNKNISNIMKDWRVAAFNDYYVSYNPLHRNYRPTEVPERYEGLKLLPLPFDASKIEAMDFSNAEPTVCQTLSNLAMAGAYSKQTMCLGQACKEVEMDTEIIFGESSEEAMKRKSAHPILFDNLQGMFGVTSLEAMALGQAVICYVEPEILTEYETLLGAPPPIINPQNREELKEVLDCIKSGKIDWKAKGQESRAFMEKYYTPEKITRAYVDFFSRILQQNS